MSYRLITKATLTLANNEFTVDIRAYASPKGAAVGTLSLNGSDVPFKLTGGQGRGSVVRCYAYFPLGNESAYIEITKDQMTELKSGNHATITTQAAVDKIIASPEAPDTVEDIVDAISEAAEPVAPKATRKSRKVAA
jgi:hypothetical protein